MGLGRAAMPNAEPGNLGLSSWVHHPPEDHNRGRHPGAASGAKQANSPGAPRLYPCLNVAAQR
jgi:hypothetical protein